MEYFFLGEAELVTAFRFVGVNGLEVTNSEQAVAAFRKITEGYNEDADIVLPSNLPGSDTCLILLITQEVSDWLGDYMIEWQFSGKYPLLVELPVLAGNQIGRKTMVEAIREAIGIHV